LFFERVLREYIADYDMDEAENKESDDEESI